MSPLILPVANDKLTRSVIKGNNTSTVPDSKGSGKISAGETLIPYFLIILDISSVSVG